MRVIELRDEDSVAREIQAARERALAAALASLDGDRSPSADLVRQELTAQLEHEEPANNASERRIRTDLHRSALAAARDAVFSMRSNDEIGDDAFHRIEEELDRLELASVRR
jgi:CPA1 family monovalent cation:H+ antiporter